MVGKSGIRVDHHYKVWAGLFLFHDLATTSNISATGTANGISQSACSRRLSAFEKEVGMRLFRREARGISLTVDGAKLFSTTRQAYLDIRNKTAKAIRSPHSGRGVAVPVAVPITPAE
jgi:DNA-binding transcriptional LysR family regulator